MRETAVWMGLALLLAAGASTVVDPDGWHQMALFREALATGALPTEDVFAYTPTVTPSIQHEWGAGAVLYVVGTAWGTAGLQALRIVLVGLSAVAVAMVARRRGASVAALALLGPLAVVMAWITLTAVRAQLYTVAFVSLLLWTFEIDRDGRRWWVVLWLLGFALWVNLHAGFVVGLGFLGLHTVEQWIRGASVRHLVAMLVMAIALVACTPYGVAYYAYLAHALTLDRVLVTEWRPLWEANPVSVVVVGVSLLVAMYAVLKVGLRQAPGLALLVVAYAAALRHERHVGLLAPVWLAQVPALVDRTRLGEILRRLYERSGPAVAAGLLSLGILGVAAQRPWRLRVPTTFEDSTLAYPAGVARYLDEHDVRANVMVPFTAGAFLSWKLHPRIKVSIDGRYEVAYEPGLLAEHLDFYHLAPGWRAILDRYPTDLVLASRALPAAQAMHEDATWPLVYQDDVYLLFERPGLALPVVDRRGETLHASFP